MLVLVLASRASLPGVSLSLASGMRSVSLAEAGMTSGRTESAGGHNGVTRITSEAGEAIGPPAHRQLDNTQNHTSAHRVGGAASRCCDDHAIADEIGHVLHTTVSNTVK